MLVPHTHMNQVIRTLVGMARFNFPPAVYFSSSDGVLVMFVPRVTEDYETLVRTPIPYEGPPFSVQVPLLMQALAYEGTPAAGAAR